MKKRTKLTEITDDFTFEGDEIVEIVTGPDAGLRGKLVNLTYDTGIVRFSDEDDWKEYAITALQLVV